MPTIEDLKQQLEDLKEARRTGVKRIVTGERDVTYKSDDDMRQAQRELEEEIGRVEQPVGRRRRARSTIAIFRSGL